MLEKKCATTILGKQMNSRMNAVELRPSELDDSNIATLYLECLAAEKRLRGASKVAASAVFELRESRLATLWARLAELDEDLHVELQEAVRDWHEVAVKLRGGA